MTRASRRALLALCAALSAVAFIGTALRAEETPPVQLATLLRAELEAVVGTEVIMSRVEAAPGATLPAHYHPGEEFLVVLEGSGIMKLEGEPDVTLSAGDTFKVPLKKVHGAEAGPEGFTAIVFRVHEMGQPERVMVK